MFVAGATFSSWESFDAAFKMYQEETNSSFVIGKSKSMPGYLAGLDANKERNKMKNTKQGKEEGKPRASKWDRARKLSEGSLPAMYSRDFTCTDSTCKAFVNAVVNVCKAPESFCVRILSCNTAHVGHVLTRETWMHTPAVKRRHRDENCEEDAMCVQEARIDAQVQLRTELKADGHHKNDEDDRGRDEPAPKRRAMVATSSIVTLNVGGTRFMTANHTLLARGSSFFETLLSSPPNSNGEYFLDMNPDLFPRVLRLLRTTNPLDTEGLSHMEKTELHDMLDDLEIEWPPQR